MQSNQLYSLITVLVVASVAIVGMMTMGQPTTADQLLTGNAIKEGNTYTQSVRYEDAIRILKPTQPHIKLWFEPGNKVINTFRETDYEIEYLGFLAGACHFNVGEATLNGPENVEHVSIPRSEKRTVYDMEILAYTSRPSYRVKGDFACQIEFPTD